MTTRARDLLNRSRVLLDTSREAAAHLLNPPQPQSRHRPPRTLEPLAAPITGEEALSAICADVALRDLNLVDSLLSQLEEMEAREEDTDRLAELYNLDHLAARLRRNAENLRVLAGRDASDTASDTSALVDVIRAAMSSIDHYPRITIGRVVPLGVVGFAAEDVSRLLAELLDNATKSSAPTAPVRVGVHLTEHGSALLRVEDEGIGLPPERMRALNERLAADPVLDDDAVRHMGLAVVCRLAARHEMRTWLDRRHPHGTTASVLIPAALICELPGTNWSGTQTVAASPTTVNPPIRLDAVARATTRGAGGGSGPGANGGGRARRAPASDGPGSRPSPQLRPVPEPAGSGTTASGLPRRVSRSLKNPQGPDVPPLVLPPSPPPSPSAVPPPVPPPQALPSSAPPPAGGTDDGHEKLLADLGAFSEGERAARDEQRGA